MVRCDEHKGRNEHCGAVYHDGNERECEKVLPEKHAGISGRGGEAVREDEQRELRELGGCVVRARYKAHDRHEKQHDREEAGQYDAACKGSCQDRGGSFRAVFFDLDNGIKCVLAAVHREEQDCACERRKDHRHVFLHPEDVGQIVEVSALEHDRRNDRTDVQERHQYDESFLSDRC